MKLPAAPFYSTDYETLYGVHHGLYHGKRYPGYSMIDYISTLVSLVDLVKPERLLDYGSGKGYQYLTRRVHEQWGGLLPYCYDPGVFHLRERLPHKPGFDGVICTDVLEHIEVLDLKNFLDDLFAYVRVRDPEEDSAFVFLSICCQKAKKLLPDGRNVHLTVRDPEWWWGWLDKYRRPGLILEVEFDHEERECASKS